MAILFMDGFDARDMALKYTYVGYGYNGQYGEGLASFWGGGRLGGGTSFGGVNAYGALPYFTKFITSSSQVTVGVAVYSTNPTGVTCNLVRLYGDNGSVNHLTVRLSGGSVQVMRGGTAIISAAAAIIPANTWQYLEVQASVHSTTGSVTLKLDGVTIGSFTGNTKNGGTADSIDAVQLYFDAAAIVYVDDFYVLNSTGPAPNNTFLGDVRVQAIVPNAAGASTNFTPSAGTNYAAVDELPASSADYVRSSTSGHQDLYGLTDISPAANVFGIQTNIMAKKTDSGSISLRAVIRSSGTNYSGSPTALLASDRLLSQIFDLNPVTSVAWSQVSINALEAGFEVV